MNADVERLREHLDRRDIASFLQEYEEARAQGSVELTTLTQRVFPGVLRELLDKSMVSADAVLQLWRLIRTGQLLVIDNALLHSINDALASSWVELHGTNGQLPEKLLTFDEEPHQRKPAPPSPPRRESAEQGAVAVLERVVIVSSFLVGTSRQSDAYSLRRNMCESPQEREFLLALRQYFPSLLVYPNVVLSNFIDIDRMTGRISERHRSFARFSRTDALLVGPDEEPLAGFELDSRHHDSEDAQERDQLKDELFEASGVPLIRIRSDDPQHVRSEDFYDLLCEKADVLDRLRPRRLRPRRTHDTLVPAQVQSRRWRQQG